MEKKDDIRPMIDAFDQMWGNYPNPAMLLNKKHDIMAVNKAARNLGIPTGIKCHSLTGKDRQCADCKAPLALKQAEGIRAVGYEPAMKMVMDSYWVPVAGSSEYYVHFGNDITPHAKPDLFPENG